jgi:hypothetical protein
MRLVPSSDEILWRTKMDHASIKLGSGALREAKDANVEDGRESSKVARTRIKVAVADDTANVVHLTL